MRTFVFLLLVAGVADATCTVYQLAPGIQGEQTLPSIFQSHVVWINDHRVYGFHEGRGPFLIDQRYSTEVKIHGSLVVWVGFDKESQLYLCDLRRHGQSGGCSYSDEKYQLTNYTSLKKNLALYRGTLTWQDNLHGNWDIAVCSLRENTRCVFGANATYVISELGARVRTLENKYNLLGERLLIVNQNMIEEYKKLIKELRMINADVREIKADIATVKETVNNLVSEMENFARKDQIKVVEKYIDLLNPLRFVTEEQLNERLKRK